MTAEKVTIKDIRDAVMNKIDRFKDSDTRIYGEEIKQGFKEPCFFVDLLSSNHNLRLYDRYKRDHLIDVHYFPAKSQSENAEMLEMAETLYSELELIEVAGRPARGVDLRHEIRDGVLHFFVRYTLNVQNVAKYEHERMGYLHLKGVLKGD